jgi:hypothetical protein
MSLSSHHSASARSDSLDFFLSDAEDQDLLSAPGNLYRAGDCPAPGLYRQVDGPRTVEIKEGESLPASFDGHVACYRRVERLWGQIEGRQA